MKTKILIITVITLMSLSAKAQQFQLLTDTNVIFYDYIPDVIISNPLTDTLKIDINQDGLHDIQFYLHYYSPGGAYVKTLNGGCKIAFFVVSNTNDSLTNSSLNWGAGDAAWASGFNYQNRLGVKITVGADNYYGWVHVTYSVPSSFTIDKYAFCKVANYPFLYGQTEITTQVPAITTPDSTNVFLNGLGSAIIVQSGKLIKQVKLTSSIGATVAVQNNVYSNSTSISTVGLVHGTYIVKVHFTDQTFYTKQIVL